MALKRVACCYMVQQGPEPEVLGGNKIFSSTTPSNHAIGSVDLSQTFDGNFSYEFRALMQNRGLQVLYISIYVLIIFPGLHYKKVVLGII